MKLINQENRPVFFLVRTLYQFTYLFICLSSSEDIFSLPLEGEEEGVGSRDRERERERQREREKRETTAQSVCSLIMPLIFSIRIFELPAVS